MLYFAKPKYKKTLKSIEDRYEELKSFQTMLIKGNIIADNLNIDIPDDIKKINDKTLRCVSNGVRRYNIYIEGMYAALRELVKKGKFK